jgi:hypothetical protein
MVIAASFYTLAIQSFSAKLWLTAPLTVLLQTPRERFEKLNWRAMTNSDDHYVYAIAL